MLFLHAWLIHWLYKCKKYILNNSTNNVSSTNYRCL